MNETIEYLKKCDEAYHNGQPLVITDKEYDILKRQAMSNYPEHPYFNTVGARPEGVVVKLPFILGSLTKTKHDGTLLKWARDNKIEGLVLSDKLDGVSIFAEYQDGNLVMATTRGDGYEGRDITEKVRLVQPHIKWSGKREIRGEAVMTAKNCKELGYSLPRSAVAGILNGDDQEHRDKMKYVDFVWYNVMGQKLNSYEFHYIHLHASGLQIPSFKIVDITDDLEDVVAEWFRVRKADSKYDIDGVVVSDERDATVGEDYYPSNSVAFKVNEEAVITKVTDVVWEVKRSGKLQPVVHFEPIVINGSTITKATGFNYKFINSQDIGPKAEIGIVKSGDIIPYITECYTRNEGFGTVIPTNCPSCGSKLTLSNSDVDLFCCNTSCKGRMVYKIEHFLLAHEVEEITATTIRKLGITSIEDLYSLSEFDVADIEGMGMKRGEVIVREIQKTLNTTQEKLLKSFGIKGIGSTASEVLINKFGSIEKMFHITINDVMELDGFGEVMANNFIYGLSKRVKLYEFLIQQGLTFEEKASADLQGKVFTLTGKSDMNRNDLVKMISSHGGMVKGISKKVDYLVTNDTNSQSSKMKKAIQYGIEIISYDDLLSIIS